MVGQKKAAWVGLAYTQSSGWDDTTRAYTCSHHWLGINEVWRAPVFCREKFFARKGDMFFEESLVHMKVLSLALSA